MQPNVKETLLMRDYIVTRERQSLHIENVHQADVPQSPALALARKVNRIAFTPSGESSKHYTLAGYIPQLKKALYSIKTFVKDYAAALRSLECDLLISRSHCNEFRYLHVCLGGEAA
jgi:hypothetical protein